MKFTAAALALATAVSVEGAALGERATYAVKGAAEG
jgi:pectin lyase